MASSRKKANNKIIGILFLTIIIIIYLWYSQFYTPTLNNIEVLKIDIETTQSQIDLLNIRLAKQNKMLSDIDYLKTVNPAVPAFNNFKSAATILDVILSQSNEFEVKYQDPKMTANESVASVNTARRTVTVDFNAATYDIAKNILDDIHDIPFRLQVNATSIAMTTSNVYHAEDEEYADKLGDSPVKVSLNITFFENEYLE